MIIYIFFLVFFSVAGYDIIVIAMATRHLKGKERTQAVLWGAGVVILITAIFTLFASQIHLYPVIHIVGAPLLLWVGIKLLAPIDTASIAEGKSSLFAAIKLILIAGVVMSVGDAWLPAVSRHALTDKKQLFYLFLIGLVVAIPLIIVLSRALLKLIDRFPILVIIFAALLGLRAGQMVVTGILGISIASDPVTVGWLKQNKSWLLFVVPITSAILVVGLGKWLNNKAAKAKLVAL